MKTPRWLPSIISRVQQLAKAGHVHFTLKALRELAALELELDETDVCGILAELQESDFRNRIISTATREYLYVFAPAVSGIEIYLKLVMRANCVVISFHEDLKNED